MLGYKAVIKSEGESLNGDANLIYARAVLVLALRSGSFFKARLCLPEANVMEATAQAPNSRPYPKSPPDFRGCRSSVLLASAIPIDAENMTARRRWYEFHDGNLAVHTGKAEP